MSTDIENLIEFREVTKSYRRAPALATASFTAPAGSITALLGANGAGKSTALRIAANLIRPSSGAALVLGCESSKLTPDHLRRIAYVADGMDLPFWMTVEQFINWCRPLYPKWDRALEDGLWQMFRLPRDRKLKELSRGQRMKAVLISTLSYRPELILLDEPFSGLDPLVRDQLIESLLEMSATEGWGVVVASHDIAEVGQLADRVVMMRLGRVTAEEATEDLLGRHRRVELLLPEGMENAPELPVSWVGAKRSGRVLRFFDTDYETGGFGDKLKRFVPEAEEPQVVRMNLREVFAVLATAGHIEVGG